MMRLPRFAYYAPATLREAAAILAREGPEARVVAGGTDLYPNMKRRHETPKVLVSLARIRELGQVSGSPAEGVRLGPCLTLTAVATHRVVRAEYPALARTVELISTPILRNMGTIGGNLCLDTRCTYYNQSYEWRRAIDFCMKREGEICWVAPGSPSCLAINSSDSAPFLCAIGARVRLVSASGEREIEVRDLYRRDGIEYLTKRPDEILAEIRLPAVNGWTASYRKLRRRGAFDFPVLGVAAAVWREDGGRVRDARIYLNAVASAPIEAEAAQRSLFGAPLSGESIRRAAALAAPLAKPVDNADFHLAWRKRMAQVFTERALADLLQ